MRARINERLERATRFPVTLIVAPAGFGKSVALRDFIASSHLDAIAYTVRREEATLLSFVRGLAETLAGVAPGAIASFPAMQEQVLAADEPVRAISDWFIEHLRGKRCTIAIDDLHYAAADPASIALLADLVERTDQNIGWIVAARSDVGLPVATWIAYGRMDLPIGEDDLKFTTAEALAAADTADAPIDPQEAESLRQLTEGWPVALTIALRTRTHSADLRSAAAGTREMIYRYLAEQIYLRLSEPEREFAKQTALLPAFDRSIAVQLGAGADFLQGFRAKAAFLSEFAPGEYRYHDLFRDFLEIELRRSGDGHWTQALFRAGDLLEERGDYAGALTLYIRAKSSERIASLTETRGAELFEQGQGELVASALNAIPETLRQSSAILMGLFAMTEASRGRYTLADHAFQTSIGLARETSDLRIRLVQRYATELLRRGLDCSQLLEPYAAQDSLEPSVRAAVLATLATAYVSRGRQGEAIALADDALRLSASCADGSLHARILQQAAYVYRYAGLPEQAHQYADDAVRAALSCSMYEVAARAYSVLYTLAYEVDDDPIASLSILDKLSECARKGGSSQTRLFALVGSYELEVERGNTAAIENLEPLVRESRAIFPQAYAQALLPADALRLAWDGQFKRAFDLLAPSAAQGDDHRRALRLAEISLYAAAAGLSDEADASIRESVRLIEGAEHHSRRTLRALLLLAMSELVRGHASTAHQRLSSAEKAMPATSRRLRAFVAAVRALYRKQIGELEPAPFAAALERLRAESFGGLALLISALPLSQGSEEGYATLTPAERTVLQMLVKGASTKEIASKTGRSPHTVDTHVRSICRKLGCSGRREAIALAVGAAWVQA